MLRKLACLPVIALALLVPVPARASHSNPKLVGGVGHPPPEPSPEDASPDAPLTGVYLKYFGGRVVSSAKVVQVLWGTGSYLPQVSATTANSITTFYQQVLVSSYMDWLTEYNTTMTGGTSQTIGHGSFAGQVTITPSITGSSITDAQIQAEIVSQLAAGHLPAPTTDGAGNTNTIYMIYFPNGKSITGPGGGVSCQAAGGFCGYHGTIAAGGGHPELYYGIFPDFQSGTGCDTACGSAATTFGNVTSVSSHELVETITDPEIGLATVAGPPIAWYDSANGESADICNAQQGSFVGTDSQTYVVQQIWSNYAGACIVTRPIPNDFAVSLMSNIIVIPRNMNAFNPVVTQTTSGNAQSVALSVSGLTSGAFSNFSPSAVTSGANSMLFLGVLSSTPSGSYPFTITGTAASGAQSSGGTLVVPPAATGTLVNGTFEAGSLAGWTTAGASETLVHSSCHSGTNCVRLGATPPTNGDSTIIQSFVAEAGVSQLSFWYKNVCDDSVAFDWASATLLDTTNNLSVPILGKTCAASAVWTHVLAPVTPGHAYTLVLDNHDDFASGDAGDTFFDDVGTVCTSAANCDDGNPCTDDTCVASACVHANNTAACNDGNACTTGDVCSGGVCLTGTGTLNCDDANPCTNDSCAPATGCVHTNNTTLCDDGNPCTDDTCDAVTGCGHANNTAACNDGNPCTTGDTCRNGACAGGQTAPTEHLLNGNFESGGGGLGCGPNAFLRDNWVGTGSAIQFSTCPWTMSVVASIGYPGGNVPGTIAQTFAPTQGAGTLSYTHGSDAPTTCTYTVTFGPSNTVVTVNALLTGTMIPAPTIDVPIGTSSVTFGNPGCVGGALNLLNFDDVSLQAGTATMLNCDDANACTADSCDPASGCVHTGLTGTACNDGNACTTGDTCRAGVCGGGTAPPVEDLANNGFETGVGATGCAPNPFQRDSWIGTGSALQHSGCPWSGPNITVSLGFPGGSAPGTISQSFAAIPVSGTLSYQHGTSLGSPCSYTVTFGPSNTVASLTNVPLPAGLVPAAPIVVPAGTTSLSFGNVACANSDLLQLDNVSIQVSVPTFLDCNDGNVCTDDSCAPATGCVHVNNTAACSDGNPCTAGDACSGGACVGTPIPAPPEAQNLTAAADKSTFSWSAATNATQYDVVRGSLAAFPVGPGGGDEACFDNLAGTTLSDPTAPPPGSGYWYLSRGENACGNGTWGNATSGPRATTTCP